MRIGDEVSSGWIKPRRRRLAKTDLDLRVLISQDAGVLHALQAQSGQPKAEAYGAAESQDAGVLLKRGLTHRVLVHKVVREGVKLGRHHMSASDGERKAKTPAS